MKAKFRTVVGESLEKIKDKDEFSRLCSSLEYFKFKFPEVAKEFENEINEKLDDKKWSGFLRELRFWKDLGIPYMYKRTMQLCLRFTNRYNEFFRIGTEIGSFTLPTKLDKFLKITLLASRFVNEIFPNIENNINFKTESTLESTNTVRGTIDWNKTILQSFQRGEKHPTQFSCIINQTNFETPENILALICLLKIQADLELLIFNTKNMEYANKELKQIYDLKTRVDFLLNRTHLKFLVTKYEKYKFLKLNSQIVREYEESTQQRVDKRMIRQRAYSELLDWLRKYRGHYIEDIMHEYADFPIQHERSLDTMYELWIFFEILNYIKKQKNAKIISKLENTKKQFAGFELEIEKKQVYFRFQEHRSGWTDETSEPDFTIEIDGEIPIIMDPKNYSTTQTGDAIHKMLGYMNNLAKFNPSIGILFFPYSIKRNQIDEKFYNPCVESSDVVFGKKLSFFTMILNPTKPEELRQNLGIVCSKIYEIIQEKIVSK